MTNNLQDRFEKEFPLKDTSEFQRSETIRASLENLLKEYSYCSNMPNPITQREKEITEEIQNVIRVETYRGLIECIKAMKKEELYIGDNQYQFYEGNVEWVYNQALTDMVTVLEAALSRGITFRK